MMCEALGQNTIKCLRQSACTQIWLFCNQRWTNHKLDGTGIVSKNVFPLLMVCCIPLLFTTKIIALSPQDDMIPTPSYEAN